MKALAHTFEQGFFFCPELKELARFIAGLFNKAQLVLRENDPAHLLIADVLRAFYIAADLSLTDSQKYPFAAVREVESRAVRRDRLAVAVIGDSGVA